MSDMVDIETLLFEVSDLREALADVPASLRCLDEAEGHLIAATSAEPPRRRAMIEAAERLVQIVRPEPPAPPAPAPGYDADPALVESFVAESGEYLADAEAAVLRLEADPTQRAAIDQIFRAFHTVKGVAAFLEYEAVTELAHRSEDLLSQAREGHLVVAGPVASLVLTAIDALKAMVAEVRTTGRAPARGAGQADLLRALEACASGAEASPLAVAAPAPAAAATPAAAEAPAKSGDGEGDASVRVRLDRLDRLIDAVGELVIAQSMVAADPMVGTDQARDLLKKVAHAGKIVRELQDLAMSLRMVPLRATFQKLARVARDASRKLDKRINLVTEGAETEVDRSMVDVIADPLVHMVRNACDHGLEPAAQRAAAGKPEIGTLTLSARHAEGSVVVELRDDGRGLDRDRILRKAIANGVVAPEIELGDSEVYRLIFLPGFSTAEQVTDMSGRGVGLDVVRRAIESLNGSIEIESTRGAGTVFRIRLPLTLAIMDGMLVRVGDQRFIIPTVSIAMSMRPTEEQLGTLGGEQRLVAFRGRTIPLFRLADLSGAPAAAAPSPPRGDGLVVVLNDGASHSAVMVDEVLGKQQVVTKGLGGGIPAVRWIAGGAILGDGRVGLIVDPTNLLARFRAGDLASGAFPR